MREVGRGRRGERLSVKEEGEGWARFRSGSGSGSMESSMGP